MQCCVQETIGLREGGSLPSPNRMSCSWCNVTSIGTKKMFRL
ncbi:MAG: hypothetical protein PHW58_06380 [Candidatus Methanofastidiosa archaeon]|nr:hypothetical protein [Candidatus Methanofastidiosa archaeon]